MKMWIFKHPTGKTFDTKITTNRNSIHLAMKETQNIISRRFARNHRLTKNNRSACWSGVVVAANALSHVLVLRIPRSLAVGVALLSLVPVVAPSLVVVDVVTLLLVWRVPPSLVVVVVFALPLVTVVAPSLCSISSCCCWKYLINLNQIRFT